MRLATRSLFLTTLAALLSTACDSHTITMRGAGAAQITMGLPKSLAGHVASLAAQNSGGESNNRGDDVSSLHIRVSVVGRSNALLNHDLDPNAFCNDNGGNGGTSGSDTTTVCEFPVTFTYPGGLERATFEVEVGAFDSTGARMYKIGPVQFQLNADGATAKVAAQAEYVGPGSDATGVIMSPRTLSLAVGGSGTATCTPTRAGTATSYAPMRVRSDNETVAGAFFSITSGASTSTSIQVFANGPGTTKIRCALDFGSHAEDAIDVTVSGFTGLSVQLLSGGGQIANVNTALPNPIVVRVVDAAGQPKPGVGIGVGFGNASGSASPSTGVTDANGKFTTTWTLGSLVGTQMLFFGFGAGGGQALTVTATGR